MAVSENWGSFQRGLEPGVWSFQAEVFEVQRVGELLVESSSQAGF